VIRVAINGFGRNDATYAMLDDLGETKCKSIAIQPQTNAHLLKYDTMLGTLNDDISADDNRSWSTARPVHI